MEEALGPDNTHTVKALPPTSWHLTNVFWGDLGRGLLRTVPGPQDLLPNSVYCAPCGTPATVRGSVSPSPPAQGRPEPLPVNLPAERRVVRTRGVTLT